MAAASNGAKVWSGHFGATGIDAKHLFVHFCPTNTSRCWCPDCLTKLARYRRGALELAGYPVSSLGQNWIGLFSQQACDEEVGGNWYHFFK